MMCEIGVACILEPECPEQTILAANGKTYRFEMHPRCGPAVLNKDGSVKESYVPSAFYRAVDLWIKRGRETEANINEAVRKGSRTYKA